MPPSDLDDADDETLVAMAGTGDAAAFGRLVARHGSRLVALAMRMTADRALAEDIAQETFARAWVQAPRWTVRGNGRPSVAAWLSRVALNLTIDQTRRIRPTGLDAAPEPADPADGADEVLIAREREGRLRRAIDGLPARQRAALSLTYDAGLSNAAGAQALETSLGAFELLLVRARRTLRLALAEETPS